MGNRTVPMHIICDYYLTIKYLFGYVDVNVSYQPAGKSRKFWLLQCLGEVSDEVFFVLKAAGNAY